jgi:hypothetical protein
MNYREDGYQQSGSDIGFVKAAELTLEYDLSVSRPYRRDPLLIESPYTCSVNIQDDRGRRKKSRLTGWWFPERQARKETSVVRLSRHLTRRD